MNIECNFQPTGKKHEYRCPHCLFVARGVKPNELPIHKICTRPEPIDRTGPTFLQRVANFSKALAAHIASGSPTCNQEQVDARFAICSTCELFDGATCRHVLCGCTVSAEQRYISKLSWADQECPAGKWGKV